MPVSRLEGVYPRECGGTSPPPMLTTAESGLSPRVRGNPLPQAGAPRGGRSIPASAGEPVRVLLGYHLLRVYPRECGGTAGKIHMTMGVPGLSPRVRGNRLRPNHGVPGVRSIPASAGEPPACRAAITAARVYPRECGGTLLFGPPGEGKSGLSPRVRGNPRQRSASIGTAGSIPASAGEPVSLPE